MIAGATLAPKLHSMDFCSSLSSLPTHHFINDDGLTITVIIEMLSQITQVIFDNGNSKRYSST